MILFLSERNFNRLLRNVNNYNKFIYNIQWIVYFIQLDINTEKYCCMTDHNLFIMSKCLIRLGVIISSIVVYFVINMSQAGLVFIIFYLLFCSIFCEEHGHICKLWVIEGSMFKYVDYRKMYEAYFNPKFGSNMHRMVKMYSTALIIMACYKM